MPGNRLGTGRMIMFYHIEASYEEDGQLLDCSTPEVLGEAYGRTYATLEGAKAICDALQDEVYLYDLSDTTVYSVWKGNLQVYCPV
jgi:hypothetical protein